MAVRVLLDRENLHLPAIRLPIPIGIIEERVSCTLPRTWDEEYFAAVVKPISIRVGVVPMGNVEIESVYNFLPILEAIVVGIKGGCVGEVVDQCSVIVPRMAVNGLPIVF